MMNAEDEDYGNVSWDVNGSTSSTINPLSPEDLSTPSFEHHDPLSHSLSKSASHYDDNDLIKPTNSGFSYSSQRVHDSSAIVSPQSPYSSSSLPGHPTRDPSSSSLATVRTVNSTGTNVTRDEEERINIDPIHREIIIRVTDPIKEGDGSQGTYVSYAVETQSNLDGFPVQSKTIVRRRFQDFVWLHTVLHNKYPASVVPPLPEKHRIEYWTGNRFTDEFMEKRRAALQRFLERIARHPILQKSEVFILFLSSMDFKNDKAARANRDRDSSSMLEALSDVLLNAFTKIRKPDERFIEMGEGIDKLEENLITVEKIGNRIGKRWNDLEHDYIDLADSIQGLAILESGVSGQLQQFAQIVNQYVDAMKRKEEKEDIEYLSEIHEYLAYCQAVKSVLKLRDQKQLDFEDLSEMLQSTIQERDRTKAGRHTPGISGYLNDKMNEVRGVDLEHARQERLKRLEEKIDELQNAVEQSNEAHNGFSKQVGEEFDVFQNAKTIEMRQSLLGLTEAHVDFYQEGIKLWESIIPMFESIKVD